MSLQAASGTEWVVLFTFRWILQSVSRVWAAGEAGLEGQRWEMGTPSATGYVWALLLLAYLPEPHAENGSQGLARSR